MSETDRERRTLRKLENQMIDCANKKGSVRYDKLKNKYDKLERKEDERRLKFMAAVL